jgi:hypothetical protein
MRLGYRVRLGSDRCHGNDLALSLALERAALRLGSALSLALERAALRLGSALALALWTGDAWATGGTVDTSYGRIDGDVGVVLGAGVVVAPRGPRAEAEVRVRYLETAGLFTTYEDGPILDSASEPKRTLAIGLELRPLFLFRWLRGHESGQARVDLALDSIGFELGAVLQQPAGADFASQRGMQAGIGIELPILERATGPWVGLRGTLRWSDAFLGSGAVESADDRQAILTITIAWHQTLSTHVVDLGDRPAR